MSRYLKAITAFVSGFSVPFAGALTATSDAGTSVTQGEWITALVGGIVAGFLVGAVPNKPPKGQPSDPGISEQGLSLIEALVAVILVGLAILVILAVAARI